MTPCRRRGAPVSTRAPELSRDRSVAGLSKRHPRVRLLRDGRHRPAAEHQEAPVQFLLMAMEDEAAFEAREDPARAGAYWQSWTHYLQALTEAGVLVGAGGLEPPGDGDDGPPRDRTATGAADPGHRGAGRPVRRHQGAAGRVLRRRGRRPRRGAGAGRGGARPWTAARARCARSCRPGRDRCPSGRRRRREAAAGTAARGGRRPLLVRPARRLPRVRHGGHRRGGGRARGRVRRRPGDVAGPGRARPPGQLAPHRGPPQPGRRRAPPGHRPTGGAAGGPAARAARARRPRDGRPAA